MTTTVLANTDKITVGHEQFRRTVSTVVIDGETFAHLSDDRVRRICGRCGGSGVKPEFGHVYQGECFDCRYTGLTTTWKSLQDAQKAAQRRAKAAERAAAKRDAEAAKRLAEQRERDHADALREDERRTELARRADSSRYAAEVGSKVTVTGRVTIHKVVEGFYGSSVFAIIEGTGEDAGITVKVFGTGAFLWNIDRDDNVTLTATVKSHDTYQGVKQTTVTRAKGSVLD